MASQPARQQLVPGRVPVRSDTVSGCLCDSVDTRGAVPFRSQEMGLLDSMAAGECDTDGSPHIGRACVHADSFRPVLDKRDSFTVQLVQTLPQGGIMNSR